MGTAVWVWAARMCASWIGPSGDAAERRGRSRSNLRRLSAPDCRLDNSTQQPLASHVIVGLTRALVLVAVFCAKKRARFG